MPSALPTVGRRGPRPGLFVEILPPTVGDTGATRNLGTTIKVHNNVWFLDLNNKMPCLNFE